MWPPQERPTRQAVSSATPNSSILGAPASITSSASVTTAPSTQPPDTEPRKLPSLSMTRLEPTGRGAEPQVSTTVASATPRPSRRQSSAALRMSSSRASIAVSVCPLYRREYGGFRRLRPVPRQYGGNVHQAGLTTSRHLAQPRLRVALPSPVARQRPAQVLHAAQIVHRAEFVDMGQHR